MISSNESSKQIERLSGLDYFPKEPAARKELRLVGERAASVQILTKIIDSWIADHNKCPTPADLRRAIFDFQGGVTVPKPDSNCARCGGTGVAIRWVIRWNERIGESTLRKTRYVADEAQGWRQLQAMPADRLAVVSSAAIDCPCLKGIA